MLTYAAYHEKKKVKQGWLCDVCGFIYEGEQLPEDYICPVCKVDAPHFSKI
ncbi:rubredoxin-like domain-containing protein [Coprobacillus cateniformis]|uniref:rubredoxin-like domain-containing protein n=1 Tax=Coprobacillus cateniformis TaxID=100884 RepID=UPI003119765A